MKQLNLSVRQRKRTGRGHARRLRYQGEIPAVVYGRNGSHSLAVGEPAFRQLMRQVGDAAAIIQIVDDEKNEFLALIKEIQRDPVSDGFVHIDFMEVDTKTSITARVSIHAVGEPVGVKLEGGVLDVVLHDVEVRCLPGNLPERIEVDVSELHIGGSIHIRDLPELEGVEYIGADHDAPVLAVTGQEAEEESSEGEAAEGEGKQPAEGASKAQD